MTQSARRPALVAVAIATFVVAIAIEVAILRGAVDPAVNPVIPAAAMTAITVFVVAFGLPAFVRRFDVDLGRLFPWLVGATSLVLSLVPWALLQTGHAEWAAAIYRGLKVPQGTIKFWDLSLVLQSVDCSAAGVDVYAEHNGCLQDPSIYAPGTLWLKYVPFNLFSADHAVVLGVIAMVLSSLALVWIARQTNGRGQLVLLVAAASAPWLLLLERGNFDAFVVWAAILLVFLVRRWNSPWAWAIGAAGIWLMGTWKYYPFALGLMLLPVLRIRRGWLVFVGYALASAVFVIVTWQNFLFSMKANNNMVDLGDVVVLGRIPVVARIYGGDTNPATYQVWDLLFFLLALAALVWGVMFARGLRRRGATEPMLAIGGSTLFLTSVLVAGFGWAYKAAFLLLAVPLLALPRRRPERPLLYSSLVALVLTGVVSVVVWNTALATSAGIIAAAFAFGAAATLMVGLLRDPGR